MSATNHPDEADLLRLAAGDLGASEAEAIRTHIETCSRCRKRSGETRRVHLGLEAIVGLGSVPEGEARLAEVVPVREAGRLDKLAGVLEASDDAERAADAILAAARLGPDDLAAALRAMDGTPYRGFALLYAAQKGGPLVGIDPRKARALAKAIHAEASDLESASPAHGLGAPAPRQAVRAEAVLLESQALVHMGEASAARTGIAEARALFAESGDRGFGAALCDYFEGEAASLQHDDDLAEMLIRRALRAFEELGQGSYVSRARAALDSPRNGRDRRSG